MIILAPPSFRQGRWKLPAEFVDPNHFTLASPSSQQILESRGLTGYGSATAPYAYRRMVRTPPRGYGQRWRWSRFANRVVVP